MHITLTGSHGFIGTHLRESLESQGHILDCWDNKIGRNANHIKLLPETDLVIHLSALADVRRSLEEPEIYWEQNVECSQNIFNLCNEKGIKVIYASSSTAREWWRNPYAMSKKVCEQMAPENSCGMRFSTVWGKGARPTMLIPRIAEKNLLYATSHTRDFIHVSDIVSAINVIIKRGCVGVVEIGSGKGVAVDQLVAMNGIDVPIKEGSDVEQDENVLESSSLRTLGWRPLVDVMEVDIKEYL